MTTERTQASAKLAQLVRDALAGKFGRMYPADFTEGARTALAAFDALPKQSEERTATALAQAAHVVLKAAICPEAEHRGAVDYVDAMSTGPRLAHADEALTRALKQALALVDVKVLDHFIVGAGVCMSFAERGLL